MNIQKIPMRPVICLLLVVLLISTFFSVSVFADETDADYIEIGKLEDWEDHLLEIVSGFCSEFGSPDLEGDVCGSFSPRNPIFVDDLGTCVYLEKSDFQTLIVLYNELCGSSIPPISYDFTQTHYHEDTFGDYYRIPLSLENFSAEPGYLFDIIVPPDTEAPAVPNPYSTLSQAVSASSISAVLDQVLDLLPVVVGCIVGFVAIRKGLSFLESILHSA